MPPHSPQHLLHCEETQNLLVVRFTVSSLREDRDITAIFNELKLLVEQVGHRQIILSFQKVNSIASYFIGKLIELHLKLQAQNGRLALCDLTPVVQEIIDLMSLSRKLSIYPTEQDAIGSFT